MRSSELLIAARGLLSRISVEEVKEDLQTLTHQIEVLIDDERHGDTEQTRSRRSQLYERLVTLAGHGGAQLDVATPDVGFTTGGILAIRSSEDIIPLARTDLEDLVGAAINRISRLSGADPPTLSLYGAGVDFWFFEERGKTTTIVELLRSLYQFGLALQVESRFLSSDKRPIAFCVDYENDATTVSIRGRPTLLSTRLRLTQAVLIGARPGHILLSGQVADILNITDSNHPRRSEVAELLDTPPSNLSHRADLIQLLTTSKKRHEICALTYYNANELIAGATEPYIHFAAIEHRDTGDPGRPGAQFIDLLVSHDSCVILGVTHEDLIDQYLRPAAEERARRGKRFWNRIVVLFPTADAARRVMDGLATEDRLQRRAHGLRTVVSFLKASTSPASDSWKVAEYQENLSFVGNWTSEGPRNSIRLSPLLPGLDLKKTFIVELIEGTKAFSEARQSFVAIESNSIRVGEWNLLGQIRDGQYIWRGILNRGKESKSPLSRLAEAVVLVIVHGLTTQGRRVYLQLRSNMNGSSSIGLYSNISGLVTTHDAYAAAAKVTPSSLFADDEAIYGDIVSNDVLRPRQPLPTEIWRHAAAREIDEELGLQVGRDRFVSHGHLTLARAGRTTLYFEICSLDLNVSRSGSLQRSEIQQIRAARPLSGLDHEFSIGEIQAIAGEGRLNSLLAENIDYFVSVYKELGVVDD